MPFTVMTWNVENFFPVDVGAGPRTQAEYDAKLATLANVIAAQDPDVVALQEVGDAHHEVPRSLKDLVTRLGAGKYTAHVSKHPDPRGIRVALLFRAALHASPQPEIVTLPTASPLGIHDLAGVALTQLGRGAVHARANVQGKIIHVIAAHLKSKLLDFPGGAFTTTDEDLRLRVADAALIRRAAEAAAIRLTVSKLRREAPDEAVMVMGDLNDGPSAATTQLLYGPPGSQPGTGGFDAHDAGDDQRLFNLTGLIPPERRYSRVFEGSKELIDHILVSVGLVPQIDARHKHHPVVDSLVDFDAAGTEGNLPSLNENPSARQGKPASDHAPIVARFEL